MNQFCNNRKKKKLPGVSTTKLLSYYKVFYRKYVDNGNAKTQMIMNTPAYLGLSILEPSKAVIYEFWYDCVKPKYGEKAKLCYMDTDSFFVYMYT